MIRIEVTSEADVTRMVAAFQVLPVLLGSDYEIFLVSGFTTRGRPGPVRAARVTFADGTVQESNGDTDGI